MHFFKSFAVRAAAVLLAVSGLPAHAAADAPPWVPVREVISLSQTIAVSGDPADIYYPNPSGSAAGHQFPVFLLLQGGLVDKTYYSQFAQAVASYGFIVVVPNHPTLFTDMHVITEVLDHMKLEAVDNQSPLFGLVDTESLVVSGHSYGGVSALFAINSFCNFFCDPQRGFERPPELKAVVVYGSSAGALDIENTGIPTAIIVGDLDTGQENFENTFATLESPRAFITIHNANHFGLTDISEPPGASIDPEEEAQPLPQSITATRFAYWTGQFLRTYVFYDWLAWWTLTGTGGDEFTTVTAN